MAVSSAMVNTLPKGLCLKVKDAVSVNLSMIVEGGYVERGIYGLFR
jgi:hypothetical protein